MRHLTGAPFCKKYNIITDPMFKSANDVLLGAIKLMRAAGEDLSKGHEPISEMHREQFYSSGVLAMDTPTHLLYKVFFETTLHFGCRGREGIRDIKITDITFKPSLYKSFPPDAEF